MLIARYPFFPGQGGTTLVETVGGRDITLMNAPSWGVFTNSVQNVNFDGVNQFGASGAQALWRSTFIYDHAFSISFWCQLPSGDDGVVLASWTPGSDAGFRLTVGDPNPGKIGFLLSDPNASAFRQVYGDTVVADDALHHIVATYSGVNDVSGMKLYVDGVAMVMQTNANNDPTATWGLGSNVLRVGSTQGAGPQYLLGKVGDIRIYDDELNQAAVTALFNSPDIPSVPSTGGVSPIVLELLGVM